MTEAQMTARVPQDLLDRADELIEAVQADPAVSIFGKVNRSTIVRLALVHGLATLEEKYGKPGKGKKK